MRKVKLGAIQPQVLAVPPLYDCRSEQYLADERAVYENNILRQFEVNFRLLEQAGEMGLDAVTTSEDICGVSHYILDTSTDNLFPQLAKRSAAMAEERISDIAKRYQMYIIACYMKPAGGRICNVASVFDRSGQIVGEYRKTHLPPDELWQVSPGDTVDVFQLDFAAVGIEICYDMMFPTLSDVLSMKGAQVVFHPTAGYGWYDSIGEATLRTRANDGSFHLVTAKNYCYNGAGHSSVIDHWGLVLADAGFYPNRVVSAEIDMEEQKTQPDWHYQTGMTGEPRMRERRIAERRPDLYGGCLAGGGQKPPSPEEQATIREKVKQGIFHW